MSILSILFVAAVAAAASPENPLEWEFRLSGGLTPLSGRVEMRPNSTAPWGTVCKDLFKETNYGPIAACNSAGLVGVTQATYKSDFGPGTGPIYLTNVDCTASDTFIQNCSRSALLQVGACVHYEDVGVECSPPITQWQFKMVNGTAPSNGIVIFQPMPSLPWGTVVYYNFWYNSWQFNREVLCRTMGYNTSKATCGDTRLLGAVDDATSFPPYLYVNGCPTADTSHIGYCSYNQVGAYSWTGWSGLALDCDPPAPTLIGPSITVKLVNGVTASSGLIWISTNASNVSVPWVGITGEDVTNNQHGSPTLVQSLTPAQLSLLQAVCTAAGFPDATNPIFGKYGSNMGPPGDDVGNARLIGMDFNCSDSPGTSLGDCTVGPDLKTGYSRGTSYYAGVDCFPTALNFSTWEYRLVDGSGSSNTTVTIGRVELRPNSTAPWLGVCANNEFGYVGVLWTALCRSMGFDTDYGMRSRQPPTGPSLGSTQYYLGFSQYPYCPTINNDGTSRILPNISLQDCNLSPMGMHQCSANNDLMMDCGFPDAIFAEMRLVDSTKPGAGRLEMRPSAAYEWGTVADVWQANMNYDWEVRTAYAICWSLGFLNVTNPILTMAYGPGNLTQPLWWSLVMCNPTDTNFRTCNAQYPFGFSYEYGHNYDLGVDCYPPPFEPIITLEDGGAPWKGRIMIQYTPFIPIGSVCNDLFKFNHFAWNAACRSAGFLNVTRAQYVSFGPASSSAPISVDDYVCTPSNQFLQNCTHRPYGQHNCHHGEDAGVDCYPPPEETELWEFRLADGTAATNGRLEMRPGSTYGWGSICAGPLFNHTVAAWEAACRQVGIMNPPRARWRYFPKGSDTVYLDNVSCTAGDVFLVPNCTRFPLGSFRCDPSEVAGVDCNAPAEVPSQWQFRLTDGRSATSGRLEMRPDAATPYGAVCHRGLTTFEALRSVCRSAGFPTATRPVVYRPLTPPPLTLPFYLDEAVCNASTPYLHNCSYAPLYSHDCSIERGDALYIECFPTATTSQTPSATHTLAPTETRHTLTPSQTLPETRSLAKSESRSRQPTRSVVSSPSASSRRTKSQPITPTGGWPRARTATVSIVHTKSGVFTKTLQQLHPTRTRTHGLTVSPAFTPSTTLRVSASGPMLTPTRTATRSPLRSQTAAALRLSSSVTETDHHDRSLTPSAASSADHHPHATLSATPPRAALTRSATHAPLTAPPFVAAPCPLAAGSTVTVGTTLSIASAAAVRAGPHNFTFDLQMPAPMLLLGNSTTAANITSATAAAAPQQPLAAVVVPLPPGPLLPAGVMDSAKGIRCWVLAADVLRCEVSILEGASAAAAAVASAVTVTLAIPPTLMTPECASLVSVRMTLTFLPLNTDDGDGGASSAAASVNGALSGTAAAAPFAFLADPTAYDSMAVVVVLLSRCSGSPSSDAARARYAKYLLSPLIDLGPSVVGLVHTLVPVGISLIHAGIVVAAAAVAARSRGAGGGAAPAGHRHHLQRRSASSGRPTRPSTSSPHPRHHQEEEEEEDTYHQIIHGDIDEGDDEVLPEPLATAATTPTPAAFNAHTLMLPPAPRRATTTTESVENLHSPFASVAARWRFPGASMAVAVLLYPGAAWALAAQISQQAATSSSSSTVSSSIITGQMALLSVFLVAVPVMVVFCLIRIDTQAVFIDFSTELQPSAQHPLQSPPLVEAPLPPSGQGSHCDEQSIHDEQQKQNAHHDTTNNKKNNNNDNGHGGDGDAVPPSPSRQRGGVLTFLKWACVPRGVWGPDASRRSFGPLYGFAAGKSPAVRWALYPAACALLVLVCALVGASAPNRSAAAAAGGDASCRGLHAAAAVIVLLGTVALVAVAVSARGGPVFSTPLTTALTVTGGLSLAALLAAQAATTTTTSINTSSITSNTSNLRDAASAVKETAIVINAAAGLVRSVHAAAIVLVQWRRRRSSPEHQSTVMIIVRRCD